MRSSDVIGVHIENFVDVHVYRFRLWQESEVVPREDENKKGHKLELHATTTEIETNFTTYSIHTYGWVVQLLQFVVQPHLDGEPLPDEAHLVRAVLGREEFLPPLLHLALLGEVDAQSGAARRTLAVVHGLNAALHLRCCSVVPFRRLGPGQSSEKK